MSLEDDGELLDEIVVEERNRGDEALEHVDILEDEQPHRRIHES